MKKTVFSWSVLATAIILTPAAIADPPMSWGEDYLNAGEAVIDHGYYVSEPFLDGAYYSMSLRPSDEEKCLLTKTLEDYTPEGDLTHKTITRYDFRYVDPENVTASAYGTADFRSNDDAMFERKVVQGGEFSAMLQADSVRVDSVDEDLAPLVSALKSIATECSSVTE